jgi:hypothetical protein
MPAIFMSDYFEGYPLGFTIPTGFNLLPFTFRSNIVTDGVEGSQCWDLSGGAWRAGDNPGDFVNAFSLFWALKRNFDNAANQLLCQFSNIPSPFYASGDGVVLVDMQVEQDGTISVRTTNGAGVGTLIGNTGASALGDEYFVVPNKVWFMLQLNVSLSKLPIPHSANHTCGVEVHLAIDGIELIGNSVDSGAVVESFLGSPDAVVNGFVTTPQFYLLDSMTIETQQPINTFPNPGLPIIRDFNLLAELGKLPDDSLVRVPAMAIELGKLPNDSKVRIPQFVIELGIANYVKLKRGWIVKEA